MQKTVISTLLVFLTLSMAACSNTATPSGSGDEFLIESEDFAVEESAESKNDFGTVQYEIGDIILADGSMVKETDLTIIDSRNVPIAVIAGFQDFAFSGDKNGGDNWEEICTQDSEAAEDAAVNYPAFHFVNTYAETNNLSGNYASGWYMPSIAELCDIYQNREAINNSLQHIYGLDNQAAMNGLETNWYWSSSQADGQDDYAWFVHYFNGYAGECPKNFTNVHVLAVRAF